MDLLADLNPEQLEAVSHAEGPLLILAGPGTGKTRVVTRRVAQLVSRGADPARILAVTFTNKAAHEMRERIRGLLPEASDRLLITTFHSFAARLLRADARAAGIEPSFTILDDEDSGALLRRVLKETRNASAEDARAEGGRLARAISYEKNQGRSPDDVEGTDPPLAAAWRAYERKLREVGGVDFDDLLLLAARVLEADAGTTRVAWGAAYDHVLVDEFQDVNAIQYRIARRLAAATGNLCATGDPDQSIYRWRGADVENILSFERDFPGAKVVRLVRNYRSTGAILRAADALIAHNVRRKEKTLTTDKPIGAPVRALSFADDREEARAVGAEIAREVDGGRSPRDVAVLVRTAAQTRLLEQSLVERGIAYALVGGTRFWDRREVKDLLAYLRLLANPRDVISFERIVNVPRRGIGDRTIANLAAFAAERGAGVHEVLADLSVLPAELRREKEKLSAFVRLMDELQSVAAAAGPVAAVLRAAIERTRYLDHLRETEGALAPERIENVEELLADAAQYDRETAPEVASLASYLEGRTLASDVDGWDAAAPRTTILTMHAAKGLEFPVVVIAGAEDGLIPHARSSREPLEEEEERRLLFVGVTRAMERLTLTSARRRAVAGEYRPRLPSPFLRELGPEVQRSREAGLDDRDSADDLAGEVLDDPGPPSRAAAPELRAGDEVRHPFFGRGTVTAVRGAGPEARVSVRFQGGIEKQLIVEFAKLERLRAKSAF